MKAFTVALFLLLGLAGSAAAQMKDSHAERPQAKDLSTVQADALTRQMANKLQLNEAQYIRLRAANQIKLAELDAIEWLYHSNPIQRVAKIQELESQYESQCSAIMTPSQLSLFRSELEHKAPPASNDPRENGVG